MSVEGLISASTHAVSQDQLFDATAPVASLVAGPVAQMRSIRRHRRYSGSGRLLEASGVEAGAGRSRPSLARRGRHQSAPQACFPEAGPSADAGSGIVAAALDGAASPVHSAGIVGRPHASVRVVPGSRTPLSSTDCHGHTLDRSWSGDDSGSRARAGEPDARRRATRRCGGSYASGPYHVQAEPPAEDESLACDERPSPRTERSAPDQKADAQRTLEPLSQGQVPSQGPWVTCP